MKNFNNMQAGTNEVAIYMDSLKDGLEITAMTKDISRFIEKEVVGTGKNFKVDMYALAENGLLGFEQLASFENGLNTEFTIGNKVVTNKESKYVMVVQCKMKLNTLNNLNKIQKLVYELYSANPSLAKQALEKMTPEDRSVMDVALKFER
ncbi:hypothetical protein PDK03_07220 [Bacillus cereus group sp. TH204-1LC]|uniref:hypothetical protein n=1 Tax=Bacillus cereus group sp. TH204-1LC TaxID=3018054 RepID=UPI0022E75C07|nr:hypothetical protein [Bacillus cereus group sp. TH204-1LC]MDA1616387.1 hypothetical protein [Bacillus cereus group sp. TH204-1LC]